MFFYKILLLLIQVLNSDSYTVKRLLDKYVEINHEVDLQTIISNVTDDIGQRITCISIFTDRYYSTVVNTAHSTFVKIPSLKVLIEDSEDLLSPNYSTLKMLKSTAINSCNLYVVLYTNGDQLARFLTFGHRYRTIDSRANFILIYDRRLFVSKYRFLWTKIINVIFIRKNPVPIPFELSTVPFPASNGDINDDSITPSVIDTWNKGSFQKNRKLFYDKTVDLRGELVRVVTFENIPGTVVQNLVELNSSSNRNETVHVKIYGGLEIELLKVLAVAMNFRYIVYEPDNASVERWGKKRVNGSFSGILGEIVTGRADIILGGLYYTPYHLQIFDLSIPYNTECLTFLTPASLTDNAWKTLILPFQTSMWVTVIITLFVGALSFYALARYNDRNGTISVAKSTAITNSNGNRRSVGSKRRGHDKLIVKLIENISDRITNGSRRIIRKFKTKRPNEKDDIIDVIEKKSITFKKSISSIRIAITDDERDRDRDNKGSYIYRHLDNGFLYTYGTILAVSLPRIPTGWSIRILTGWWLLYCILIDVAYRSSLTAILAKPAPRLTIDTLEELANSNIRCGGWSEQDKDFFVTSFDTTSQKVGNKFDVVDEDIDEVVKKIERGKFAYYSNSYYLNYLTVERKNCTSKCHETKGLQVGVQSRILHIMKKCVINMPISIGVQKNSPFKKTIDKLLIKIVEAGLVGKWLNDVMFQIRNKEQDQSSQTKALMNLNKLYGAFVSLFIGYIASVVVLLVEIFYWKYVEQRNPMFDKYNMIDYYRNKRLKK